MRSPLPRTAPFCRTPGRTHMAAFLNDTSGATAIEYALIASLIAVVIIGAVTAVGSSVFGLFSDVSNATAQ